MLITTPLPDGATEPLLAAGHELVQWDDDAPMPPDQLRRAAGTVNGLVCVLTDRIDHGVITAGRGRLEVVANVAVGYDNIDVAAADEAGVVVCNTPGVLDETTADLAFALILAASRTMSTAEADCRAGAWSGWRVRQYLGHDVHHKTLGVVGWGRIGQAVARRAAGFDMDVLHHARRPSGDPGYVSDLDELLAIADVVTLHVPLTAETRHLVDARGLTLMRPTAVLINTSRGPVVDEVALAAALQEGRLFAAGLDVYEHEPTVHPALLEAPRTVLLPHIGSATVETRTAMARLATRAVAEVLEGRRPANVVSGC